MKDFDSVEKARRHHQFRWIFLIGAAFLAIFSTINFYHDRNQIAFILLGSFLLASAINVYTLKTGNFQIAAWFYSSILFLLAVYLVISGGVESTGPLWVYPIIVIMISLLGHVYGFFVAVILIGVLAIFMGFGDFQGLVPSDYDEPFKSRYVVTLLALMGLAWAIEWVRSWGSESFNTLNEKIIELSRTDQLTGLFNRRGLEERFDSKVNRSKRGGESFSIGLLDIDDFKVINDKYGHLVGDAILCKVSDIISSELRTIDTVARWGGEEFAVLLSNTSLSEAVIATEKIKKSVQESACTDTKVTEEITVSIGLTSYQPSQTLMEIIDIADAALYQAKIEGKNCIRTSSERKTSQQSGLHIV
ncbi:MAG: GGDEF domain-containing protein [Gammaproteobacteria bacterium]|nr:GGDEF domain-containing protein [Gammaproteobacteria bacterium]